MKWSQTQRESNANCSACRANARTSSHIGICVPSDSDIGTTTPTLTLRASHTSNAANAHMSERLSLEENRRGSALRRAIGKAAASSAFQSCGTQSPEGSAPSLLAPREALRSSRWRDVRSGASSTFVSDHVPYRVPLGQKRRLVGSCVRTLTRNMGRGLPLDVRARKCLLHRDNAKPVVLQLGRARPALAQGLTLQDETLGLGLKAFDSLCSRHRDRPLLHRGLHIAIAL